MKKLIMATAVLACVASVVSAETVSSANIVGYTKDIAADAEFHISAMQFINATNSPETIYGDVMPKDTAVYLYNGSGYDISTYTDVFVPGQGLVLKWTTDLDLANGVGYWLETPSAAEAVLSGEVPVADSITNSIATGFQLLSYPYPVSRMVSQLDLAPAEGDSVYVFNGSGYDISTYTKVFVPGTGLVLKWSDESLQIDVGEGFWYEAVAPQTWVVNRPF